MELSLQMHGGSRKPVSQDRKKLMKTGKAEGNLEARKPGRDEREKIWKAGRQERAFEKNAWNGISTF